jgi:23S rRNA (cytosine1962-C5)-methyltransferase
MQGLEMLTPVWEDYELIDSGDFEKLERWGRWVTVRPEPQAIWHKGLPRQEWDRLSTAVFRREGGSDERGRWLLVPGMPEQWTVTYGYREMRLCMRLGLTSFKHVGLFPEQAENWNFIYDSVRDISRSPGDNIFRPGSDDIPCPGKENIFRPAEENLLNPVAGAPKVLNLFAYTGGASLAARAAGADVTHVDSVKQVVSWSRGNMELSGMDNIRWVIDDALKFVRREVKRGRRYDGIILDPPAYGRGPDGEKWVLEQNLGEMLECCAQLLAPKNSFLILNLYSMGLSALLARSAVNQLFPRPRQEQFGELFFYDRASMMLPLGVYYRCRY